MYSPELFMSYTSHNCVHCIELKGAAQPYGSRERLCTGVNAIFCRVNTPKSPIHIHAPRARQHQGENYFYPSSAARRGVARIFALCFCACEFHYTAERISSVWLLVCVCVCVCCCSPLRICHACERTHTQKRTPAWNTHTRTHAHSKAFLRIYYLKSFLRGWHGAQ